MVRRRQETHLAADELGVCYLVLAHEQAAGVLQEEAFGALATDLSASVRHATSPPEDGAVRAALARFIGPLSRMLLLSAGLLAAVNDELDVPPAPGRAPLPRPVRPGRPAPSPQDAPAPQLYGEIRAALQTPLINSIWRALAGNGQLATAWTALGPQVEATRAAADALQQRALTAAQRVPWRVAATPAALERVGLGDAAPGVVSILDTYVITLPRVLALVASSDDST